MDPAEESGEVMMNAPQLENFASVSRESSNGLRKEISTASSKGRRHRASLTTRLIANLQREAQSKSSWVVGLLFFKEDPGFENLKYEVGQRLLNIPRFRSVMKARRFPSRLDFVELGDDEIDLDFHFKVVNENKTTTIKELDDYVGTMFNDFDHPLDKPLWYVIYFPKLEDGRSCLVTNISHIIGDGIAQVEVLMRLLDKPKEEESAKSGGDDKKMRSPPKRKPPSLGPLTKTRVFLGGVWDGVFSVFSPPDKTNSLRLKDVNKPSPTKRCCFSETIDLDRVKEIKNKYEGATLNDVLVTLLTLTLKAYFEEVGDKVALKSRVRAQFPINIRSKKEGAFRGENPRNKFSYGFMPFHVSHKGDQTKLLWKTKRTLDKIKNSPSPYVQQRVGSVISNIMPLKPLNAQLLNLAAKATAQISNVPGPQTTATLAGAPIDDMRFLLYSPLSFYCGLLTYNGKLSASFCIDSALADPELLAKHWVPEFEKFYEHAMAHEGQIHKPFACLDRI